VQNNPLTRLSSDYGSKIIQKIKSKFTDEDQQLFVANFYCYLNCNQKTDFVINLDRIWKWLGYNRINDCHRVLLKNFKENQDYKIEKAALQDGKAGPKLSEEGKNLGGSGLNREYITLTVNCFKKLCLKSRTEKADQIHDYYIELEEMMNELVAEQAKELSQKLLIKDKQIIQKEYNLYINFSKKPILYIAYTDMNLFIIEK
jgi:phage anti-repressor protein